MKIHYAATFSMPTWAATPATSMTPCPKKAPTVLVDGEMIAFAHTLSKLEKPYIWYIIPKRPISHIKSAGMCNILISFVNRAHQLIYKLFFNKFFISCERFGRAHHFSESANGDEKSGQEVFQ